MSKRILTVQKICNPKSFLLNPHFISYRRFSAPAPAPAPARTSSSSRCCFGKLQRIQWALFNFSFYQTLNLRFLPFYVFACSDSFSFVVLLSCSQTVFLYGCVLSPKQMGSFYFLLLCTYLRD